MRTNIGFGRTVKIMELTAKERVNFCVLNEPYLYARYATAESKYHVRAVMDKILKVIPLPKKVVKNDLTGQSFSSLAQWKPVEHQLFFFVEKNFKDYKEIFPKFLKMAEKSWKTSLSV